MPDYRKLRRKRVVSGDMVDLVIGDQMYRDANPSIVTDAQGTAEYTTDGHAEDERERLAERNRQAHAQDSQEGCDTDERAVVAAARLTATARASAVGTLVHGQTPPDQHQLPLLNGVRYLLRGASREDIELAIGDLKKDIRAKRNEGCSERHIRWFVRWKSLSTIAPIIWSTASRWAARIALIAEWVRKLKGD